MSTAAYLSTLPRSKSVLYSYFACCSSAAATANLNCERKRPSDDKALYQCKVQNIVQSSLEPHVFFCSRDSQVIFGGVSFFFLRSVRENLRVHLNGPCNKPSDVALARLSELCRASSQSLCQFLKPVVYYYPLCSTFENWAECDVEECLRTSSPCSCEWACAANCSAHSSIRRFMLGRRRKLALEGLVSLLAYATKN